MSETTPAMLTERVNAMNRINAVLATLPRDDARAVIQTVALIHEVTLREDL